MSIEMLIPSGKVRCVALFSQNRLSKRMHQRIRKKSPATQARPAASFEAPGARFGGMACCRSVMASAVMSSTMPRMPMSTFIMPIAMAVPRIMSAVVSVVMPTAVRPVGGLRIVLNGRGIVGLWSVIGGSLSVIPAADLITASRVVAAPTGIATLALGLGRGTDRASGKGDGPCENSKSQLHSHKALLTGICSTCRHTALPQVDHSMHTHVDNIGLSSVSEPFAGLDPLIQIALAAEDRVDYREHEIESVRC